MTEHALTIDPPVGLGSSAADIRAWIVELEGMDPAPEVDFELDRARRYLVVAEQTESEDGSGAG